MISLTQKAVPNNTQHSQETARGGIRTRNHSRRVSANPFIRSRGHWIGCHTYCGEIHVYFDFGFDTLWSCREMPAIESNIHCPSSEQKWTYFFLYVGTCIPECTLSHPKHHDITCNSNNPVKFSFPTKCDKFFIHNDLLTNGITKLPLQQ
jgi:hypothetical protein